MMTIEIFVPLGGMLLFFGLGIALLQGKGA